MSSLLQRDVAPAFDEPLEMLDACHGRIKAQLETLARLAQHLPRHGSDAQAIEAARGILRYFSTAAPHHHEDEESDLFPMLTAQAQGGDVAVVTTLLARLLADHRQMDVARDAMLARLARVVAGEAVELPAAAVSALRELYLTHIDLETQSLLPLAARLLPPEQIETLGRRMAARRGVVYVEASGKNS